MLSAQVSRRLDFDFLEFGRQQKVHPVVLMAMILVTIVCVWFGYQIISGNNLHNLQVFYAGLFGGALAISLMLFIRIKHLGWRISLALFWSSVLVFVAWKFNNDLVDAIIMASALLWIGPAVTKLWRLPIGVHLGVLFTFMLIDVNNILNISGSEGVLSDAALRFNGIITFGDYSLGIGDFFIGYWAMTVIAQNKSWAIIALAAFLISFTRWFLRLSLQLDGIVLPYTVVIVPVTLLVMLLPKFRTFFGRTRTASRE